MLLLSFPAIATAPPYGEASEQLIYGSILALRLANAIGNSAVKQRTSSMHSCGGGRGPPSNSNTSMKTSCKMEYSWRRKEDRGEAGFSRPLPQRELLPPCAPEKAQARPPRSRPFSSARRR